MKTNQTTPNNIDEYVAGFSDEVQEVLEEIRATIKKAAPGAREIISYKIPAFALDGVLVYFAAFKKHIGLYPRTTAIAKFKKELSGYKSAKGSVQFPLDRPMPLALISRIVKFRVKENRARAEEKRRQGSSARRHS